MPIEYINRKEKKYYLHQGKTKTGKPRYFFSLKTEGKLVEEIPDGYEVYENPNAQVFLRKIQPQLITDEEIEIVQKDMEKFSSVKSFKIDVKKKIISIFIPDQDVAALEQLFSPMTTLKGESISNLLANSVTYSAILRFILTDEKERLFLTQRYCYLGSIDDWIDIGQEGDLAKLVKTYVKHIGKESYYELW